MNGLAELTDKVRAHFSGGGAGFDRSIRLDLRGEGVIRVEGAEVTNLPDPADLVISVSRRDLEALAKGELNPMTAAITGRLKVSDMGLAMSLMTQVKALLAARTGEA
ncbi:MAG: SCP2 sterol-binding domain-containing protein [Phenylobacterium sp.]|jgi:putative sterol carrier protein